MVCNINYTMNFIFVLVFSLLVTVSVGTLVKRVNFQKKSELVSPLVVDTNITPQPEIMGSKSNSSVFGWPTFINNYYGYKIKHPLDVSIKNRKNGNIDLQKSGSINLSITQDILAENDTVNTMIEKAITKRKNELKDKFTLVNSISPIALGSVTAQTYTSSENEKNITYYYIPREDNKYLLVINQTPSNNNADYLISEDIIYSLEFIP